MRNIKLTIQYDGSNYCGWQIQPNGPTIQGLVTDFLSRLQPEPIKLTAAGRTDAGVHARGQVANFFLTNPISCTQLKRALNGSLPFDIRVIAVEEVDPSFHARYSARQKTYHYQIARSEVISPFDYRYYYHYPHPLNFALMQQTAALLVGTHDFAAFATASQATSSVRTLTIMKIEETSDQLHFYLTGNGFLRYMVRTIVGTLLEVGRGKMSTAQIATLLNQGQRTQAGPTAPACGLTLVKVDY